MRSDSFNRINKTASLWEQRYWKHGFVSNGQILFISNPLSMNLIEIKSNYARTTSFIIYLNNFNKKLDRYWYFFFFWKTFRNVKQYFLCNNKIRIDWNFQEDGVCKITRFFSRIIRTFFFFARYWIRTQRFRNLISFAFLFEKCIDPSPPSTNNCCRLHLLHFCFPVVFPFFLYIVFFFFLIFQSHTLLRISFRLCQSLFKYVFIIRFSIVQFLFHRPIR